MGRKYRGKLALANIGAALAYSMTAEGVPVWLTGSTARFLASQGQGKKPNDLDFYVNGFYQDWAPKVRRIFNNFGFREIKQMKWGSLHDWDRQFFAKSGPLDWIKADVFYYPVHLTRHLRGKIRNGLLLMEAIPTRQGGLRLKGGYITGGQSIKTGRTLTVPPWRKSRRRGLKKTGKKRKQSAPRPAAMGFENILWG